LKDPKKTKKKKTKKEVFSYQTRESRVANLYPNKTKKKTEEKQSNDQEEAWGYKSGSKKVQRGGVMVHTPPQ